MSDLLIEANQRLRQPPTSTGLPEFEALILLKAIKLEPGLQKSEVVSRCKDDTAQTGNGLAWYRYIDDAVGLHYVYRNRNRFYITQSGQDEEARLTAKYAKLLRKLTF